MISEHQGHLSNYIMGRTLARPHTHTPSHTHPHTHTHTHTHTHKPQTSNSQIKFPMYIHAQFDIKIIQTIKKESKHDE